MTEPIPGRRRNTGRPRGRPRRERKLLDGCRLSLLVEPETYERLKRVAARRHTSMAALVRTAVARALAELDRYA